MIKRATKPMKKKNHYYIGTYIIIAIVVLFVLLPIYIMVITSLTSSQEANNAMFSWWPKEGLTVQAYIDAFSNKTGDTTLIRAFLNTLWIYIPGIIVGLFTATISGYAFAKMNFIGKNVLFSFLIATMAIPNSMGMVANFIMYDTIGWINTPFPLMIPPMFGTVTVMFFMRQFISGIPSTLLEAGKVDGLRNFGCCMRIALPISVPAIVAQFILQFIVAYNDYLNPLLYLQDANMYTLQIALAYFQDVYIQDWSLRMAGCVIAIVPMVVLYFAAQKYILRGVAVQGGVKG